MDSVTFILQFTSIFSLLGMAYDDFVARKDAAYEF